MAKLPEDYAWFATSELNAWTDPDSGRDVQFRSMLIVPRTGQHELDGRPLPVAVYFPSLGEKADAIVHMAGDWARIAPEPFVLVAPVRPTKMWWFIDDDSDYGWVQGNFRAETVALFSSWLIALSGRSGIDAGRFGLFGWSAGAYAVSELLAFGSCPLSGVGLGGVHGHGNNDVAGLPAMLAARAPELFEVYLERLRGHQGVPWIEATHGNTDQESRWEDAQDIFQVLTTRQEMLGYPAVSVRELAPEDQDVRPKKRRNKTHHNYFAGAFYREEFLVALFGGEAPEPSKVVKRQTLELLDAEGDPDDMMCWDLLNKGFCPRGSACRYCRNMGQAENVPLCATVEVKASMASWDDSDMSCWDMQTKGFCPRAEKCKYCNPEEVSEGTTKQPQQRQNNRSQQYDQADMTCWDMQKKGYCPRAGACKYCKAAAAQKEPTEEGDPDDLL
mmetsp:Transcript_83563/g.194297  ORF Transcript_83563/g.194297 Transcript_83563/m.194297 type:complete len:445 (-) Transcript_83563:73-1407(-)